MKKLLAVIALSVACVAGAQTVTTNSVDSVLGILDHTNLYFGAGMSYDLENSQPGAVVGLAYALDLPLVQDMLMPEVRFDFIQSSIYGVEGTLTIKPPRSIAGKWFVKPIAEVAIATAFSGAGTHNGTAIPIVGTGVMANVYKGWHAILGYEWWFQPDKTHEKILFAISHRL